MIDYESNNYRSKEANFLYKYVYKRFDNLFSDNKKQESEASLEDLIDSIQMSDGILLEYPYEELSKEIEKFLHKEILDALPCINYIIQHPRTFIKTVESKVPVQRAKTINNQAISRLSRDSNDWYARTYLNVIPKNIVANVYEETINLYENRFVYTLINRLVRYARIKKNQIDLMLMRINSNNLETVKNDMLYSNNDSNFGYDSDFLSNLNEVNSSVPNLVKQEERLYKLSNAFNKILTDLNLILSTDFYKELRKYPEVKNPIKPTNLLRFNKYYRVCYELWETMNNPETEKIYDKDYIIDSFSKKDIDTLYYMYVFINVLGSLKSRKFKHDKVKIVNQDE